MSGAPSPTIMDEEEDAPDEDADEPFGDLLDEIDRKRREDRDDPFEALGETDEAPAERDGELFTDESFEAVDTEELWDDLTSDREADDGLDDREESDPGIVEEAETHVVPKRAFCETCQHLTGPPEFRCTHDGTQIVEFVDTDHVRVRDCPIVAERRHERE